MMVGAELETTTKMERENGGGYRHFSKMLIFLVILVLILGFIFKNDIKNEK
jgi:hypothetical protein